MAQTGIKGVRAAFADAMVQLAPKAPPDPPSHEKRDGYDAGRWPGAPSSRLPPGCPVTPLGKNGKAYYFVNGLGEMIEVSWSEWGKKALLGLFDATPNYVAWAWPRFSAKTMTINGVEVDEACACLMKAAADRGLFQAAEKVRGRGAATTRAGELVWHSGEALWKVESGRLVASPPGEIDGVFYPRRPAVMAPWQQPVDEHDTPAHEIFAALKTWSWQRPGLDPILILGWIGVALIGGALEYRPHAAAMGDRGVGKSYLNALIKAVLGTTLIDVANATEAGIRQHMGLDTLPVAIDEFEASEDNRRVRAIVELARIAYSGGRMLRGGADHQGVEFLARNAFFCSGINLPPMKTQDKSRFAVLNLGQIDATRVGKQPVIQAEATGRMLLRQLMDAWPRWRGVDGAWRQALGAAGLDGRAQDTYGTLFAVANLLLGDAALEDAGLPITEPGRLGRAIAEATAAERAEQSDNWRDCLERLLQSTIEGWKGGEKPTIGGVWEALEQGRQPGEACETPFSEAQRKLAAAGLGLRLVDKGTAQERPALAVPPKGPQLDRIFMGTKWSEGGWVNALKQAPAEVVLRALGNEQVVKINRASMRCLLVDLRAYDRVTGEGT